MTTQASATCPSDCRPYGRFAAAAAPAAAIDPAGLTQALLAIVSEKTGYPVETLELDMDMEADLGIDSIKRVEILGAMQTQFPELPKDRNERAGRAAHAGPDRRGDERHAGIACRSGGGCTSSSTTGSGG